MEGCGYGFRRVAAAQFIRRHTKGVRQIDDGVPCPIKSLICYFRVSWERNGKPQDVSGTCFPKGLWLDPRRTFPSRH